MLTLDQFIWLMFAGLLIYAAGIIGATVRGPKGYLIPLPMILIAGLILSELVRG